VLSWVRRSRADAGPAALASPLDYSPEAYQVTIRDGAAVKRVLAASGPGTIYAASHQLADFDGLPMQFSFSVAQVSAVYGPGHLAWGEFDE
jgi:hypothetical protein